MRSTNYAHTSFRIYAFTRTVEIANEISIHRSYAAVGREQYFIYIHNMKRNTTQSTTNLQFEYSEKFNLSDMPTTLISYQMLN